MKVNLSTVASKCGVSITTVSRVLSGKDAKYRISPKTAERVRAEARRSCYVSNKFAQNLRSEDTKTIGLLIPSLDNLYFAQMSSVIISEIRRHGYSTLVMDTMEDEKIFEESLAQPIGDMAMLSTKILFRSIIREVNTVSQLKVASTFVSGNSIAKCKD